MTVIGTNVTSSATSEPAYGSVRPAWGAVLARTLCVVVLIASEFMPVSLLTPIAQDLGLTEGQAGQAISIFGLFAVMTSLLIMVVVGRLDRRIVVIGMALLLAVSGTVVALAPDFLVLMTDRWLSPPPSGRPWLSRGCPQAGRARPATSFGSSGTAGCGSAWARSCCSSWGSSRCSPTCDRSSSR
ncbi:MFS transporter [Rubellimicrobium arenae]|uniref:MFS transporter n=1 Tax=Rubellimicrobium arenae TaxID=2817372 RepID=UPI001B313BFF|nr:MFS transporter [Rubellimicrobium arenae]